MGRKKNPGFYMYPDDITSSERCNALTRESTGVYFRLLLRLSKPPQPGVYRLADWVPRPNWSRSDARKCLAIADKRDRLPLFAKWLAKNDLPWDKAEVLPCLQELYDRGIIIIEGDMLIQPRMAADNKFQLPDIDNDGDPMEWLNAVKQAAERRVQELAEAAERGVDKVQKKGGDKRTKKGTEKAPEISRPRATHASPAPNQRELELEKNNNNSKGNKGGVGESAPVSADAENGKKNPATPSAPLRQLAGDSIADANGKPAPTPVSDCPPTLAEIQAFMQESGELGRIFRYITAEEYYDDGQKNGWRQRDGRPLYDWRAQLRSYEAYRRNHGDTPVAQREQQATANRYEQTSNRHQPNRAAGTGTAPTDREVVEQSVRIMQQLRSEAERDTDEPLL